MQGRKEENRREKGRGTRGNKDGKDRKRDEGMRWERVGEEKDEEIETRGKGRRMGRNGWKAGKARIWEKGCNFGATIVHMWCTVGAELVLP